MEVLLRRLWTSSVQAVKMLRIRLVEAPRPFVLQAATAWTATAKPRRAKSRSPLHNPRLSFESRDLNLCLQQQPPRRRLRRCTLSATRRQRRVGWFLRAAPSDLAAPMLPWPLGPPTSKPYLSTQTLNPKAPYCCVELLGYPSPTCSFLWGSLWVVRCRERALQPTQEVEESAEPHLLPDTCFNWELGCLWVWWYCGWVIIFLLTCQASAVFHAASMWFPEVLRAGTSAL